jgi:hypothetical protein
MGMLAVQRHVPKTANGKDGERAPKHPCATLRLTITRQRAGCACGGSCPRYRSVMATWLALRERLRHAQNYFRNSSGFMPISIPWLVGAECGVGESFSARGHQGRGIPEQSLRMGQCEPFIMAGPSTRH